VITSAGKLNYRAIIHVAGINMLWRASKRSIQDSVANALKLAQDSNFESIALPIIGAGSGGFNKVQALNLMEEAIRDSESTLKIVIVKLEK
jgi:O-acetyl-ADP-ribose deacetylase (regulator of RNase III)